MKITAIDHIQLAMPKEGEAKARSFYQSILGLNEIEKPEPLKSRGGCWFKNENVQIHLGVEDDFRPARKAHPAFRVFNYNSFIKRLIENDVSIKEDSSLDGIERFYAEDPFGNRIEFIKE